MAASLPEQNAVGRNRRHDDEAQAAWQVCCIRCLLCGHVSNVRFGASFVGAATMAADKIKM
jgi:hypothetical protein